MATSKTISERFRKPGAARMLIWDTNDSAWLHGPKISGLSFATEKETITAFNVIKRTRFEAQRSTISQTGRVSFTLMEPNNPLALHLIYGDATTRQTVDQEEDVQVRFEKWNMMESGEEQLVAHEYGIAQAANLPAPTTATATAAGTNSNMPNPIYLFVAAGFGTRPANLPPTAADKANVDKTWTFGAVQAAGESVVMAAGTEKMTITVTKASECPTPDFHVVYGNSSDSITGAKLLICIGDVGGTAVVDGINFNDAGIQTYTAPNYYYPVECTAYDPDTDTYTWTALTHTTDCTFDLNTGSFKMTTTGSFNDGAPGGLYYWHLEPPNVDQAIGEATTGEDYRKVRFVCLVEDDASLGQEDRTQEGVMYEFYEVNVAELAGALTFPEEDYPDGIPVEASCRYDTTNSAIGRVVTYSAQLDNYIQGHI